MVQELSLPPPTWFSCLLCLHVVVAAVVDRVHFVVVVVVVGVGVLVGAVVVGVKVPVFLLGLAAVGENVAVVVVVPGIASALDGPAVPVGTDGDSAFVGVFQVVVVFVDNV